MPDIEMSMVERVARALSIADGMHQDACSNDEDETPAWTLYLGSAKAAIEAMGEPTFDMLHIGQGIVNLSEEVGKYECLSRDEISEIYASMIDAALKEHEGEKG